MITSQIAEAVKKFSPNTILVWGENHQMLAPGVHSASWVDVYQPDLCQQFGWSWLCTINNPDAWDELGEEERADNVLWMPGMPVGDMGNDDIGLWPDRNVHMVHEQGDEYNNLPKPVVVTNIGEAPTRKQYKTLIAAAEGDDTRIVSRPGWTTLIINQALELWVTAVSGRDDLTFIFDDNLQDLKTEELLRVLAEIKRGDVVLRPLSEHLLATLEDSLMPPRLSGEDPV